MTTGRAKPRCPSCAGRRDAGLRGFTLIELMIGLALVVVLMGIGVPMFRSFIVEQRLRATTSDLRVALTLARSEAVKRNKTVELKPNAGGWGDGWTIQSPTVGDPDILNHKQKGDVTITLSPDQTPRLSPAGRAVAEINFDINACPPTPGDTDPCDNVLPVYKWACLQLQLDGRINSIKGACP